jgi:hypothetical protein
MGGISFCVQGKTKNRAELCILGGEKESKTTDKVRQFPPTGLARY